MGGNVVYTLDRAYAITLSTRTCGYVKHLRYYTSGCVAHSRTTFTATYTCSDWHGYVPYLCPFWNTLTRHYDFAANTRLRRHATMPVALRLRISLAQHRHTAPRKRHTKNRRRTAREHSSNVQNVLRALYTVYCHHLTTPVTTALTSTTYNMCGRALRAAKRFVERVAAENALRMTVGS